MKHNHLLNHYQLQVLEQAVNAEKGGVHPHAYPRNETETLLIRYYQYVYDGTPCDIEIVAGALRSLYDFWACYFACGADTAFAIKEEYHRILMAELEEKHRKWEEEANARLEQEVERYGA